MLSEAELASLRATTERALPDTCEVLRSARGADGMGGVTDNEAVVGAYACRVAPAERGDEGETGGAVASVADWMITLPSGADVKASDRLRALGRVFEVKSVHDRSWELSRRVLAVEIR